jgi:hypothetical protein
MSVYLTRRCAHCGKPKSLAGSTRTGGAGRGAGKFICADCLSHARVISGTGNAREQKQLAALIRALEVQP